MTALSPRNHGHSRTRNRAGKFVSPGGFKLLAPATQPVLKPLLLQRCPEQLRKRRAFFLPNAMDNAHPTQLCPYRLVSSAQLAAQAKILEKPSQSCPG